MGEHPRFWVAFGMLLLAFALSTVMSVYLVTAAHATVDPHAGSLQVIDIQDDPGGNVKAFYDHFAELSKQGAIVRLHGYCASACTLILLREFTGIKACAADADAVFAFHKPFMFDKR